MSIYNQAIKKWIEQQHIITKEDILKNKQLFEGKRWNYTARGLLDFSGANLEAQDLRGLECITKLDLVGAKMHGTILDRAGFDHLLHLSKESKYRIDGIKVQDVIIGMDLDNVDLNGVSFSKSVFDRKAFIPLIDSLKAKKCSIAGAILHNIDLSGRYIANQELGVAGFEYMDLSGIDFSYCDFTGAKLSGVILNNSNMEGANMTDCDLSGSYAKKAKFIKVLFCRTKLSHSDFSDACFDEAKFKDAVF